MNTNTINADNISLKHNKSDSKMNVGMSNSTSIDNEKFNIDSNISNKAGKSKDKKGNFEKELNKKISKENLLKNIKINFQSPKTNFSSLSVVTNTIDNSYKSKDNYIDLKNRNLNSKDKVDNSKRNKNNSIFSMNIVENYKLFGTSKNSSNVLDSFKNLNSKLTSTKIANKNNNEEINNCIIENTKDLKSNINLNLKQSNRYEDYLSDRSSKSKSFLKSYGNNTNKQSINTNNNNNFQNKVSEHNNKVDNNIDLSSKNQFSNFIKIDNKNQTQSKYNLVKDNKKVNISIREKNHMNSISDLSNLNNSNPKPNQFIMSNTLNHNYNKLNSNEYDYNKSGLIQNTNQKSVPTHQINKNWERKNESKNSIINRKNDLATFQNLLNLKSSKQISLHPEFKKDGKLIYLKNFKITGKNNNNFEVTSNHNKTAKINEIQDPLYLSNILRVIIFNTHTIHTVKNIKSNNQSFSNEKTISNNQNYSVLSGVTLFNENNEIIKILDFRLLNMKGEEISYDKDSETNFPKIYEFLFNPDTISKVTIYNKPKESNNRSFVKDIRILSNSIYESKDEFKKYKQLITNTSFKKLELLILNNDLTHIFKNFVLRKIEMLKPEIIAEVLLDNCEDELLSRSISNFNINSNLTSNNKTDGENINFEYENDGQIQNKNIIKENNKIHEASSYCKTVSFNFNNNKENKMRNKDLTKSINSKIKNDEKDIYKNNYNNSLNDKKMIYDHNIEFKRNKKYLKLFLLSNWGNENYVGLNKIKLFDEKNEIIAISFVEVIIIIKDGTSLIIDSCNFDNLDENKNEENESQNNKSMLYNLFYGDNVANWKINFLKLNYICEKYGNDLFVQFNIYFNESYNANQIVICNYCEKFIDNELTSFKDMNNYLSSNIGVKYAEISINNDTRIKLILKMNNDFKNKCYEDWNKFNDPNQQRFYINESIFYDSKTFNEICFVNNQKFVITADDLQPFEDIVFLDTLRTNSINNYFCTSYLPTGISLKILILTKKNNNIEIDSINEMFKFFDHRCNIVKEYKHHIMNQETNLNLIIEFLKPVTLSCIEYSFDEIIKNNLLQIYFDEYLIYQGKVNDTSNFILFTLNTTYLSKIDNCIDKINNCNDDYLIDIEEKLISICDKNFNIIINNSTEQFNDNEKDKDSFNFLNAENQRIPNIIEEKEPDNKSSILNIESNNKDVHIGSIDNYVVEEFNLNNKNFSFIDTQKETCLLITS